MVTGTRTFSIEETLLEPPVINPPPTRHALFVFLIALTALLHVTTIGWGDLYCHTEGQYAGAAREMIEAHEWLSPTNDGLPRLQKPPLLYWLIMASFKCFGASAAAARLPIALGMIATVAVTFLIGERLADYWRGFFAGLIYLCSGGGFSAARVLVSRGAPPLPLAPSLVLLVDFFVDGGPVVHLGGMAFPRIFS